MQSNSVNPSVLTKRLISLLEELVTNVKCLRLQTDQYFKDQQEELLNCKVHMMYSYYQAKDHGRYQRPAGKSFFLLVFITNSMLI